MHVCDALRNKEKALKMQVMEKDEAIEDLRQELTEINTKYLNLKTARNLVSGGDEEKEAKSRFNKLVREIDKCITLLNE